MTAAKKKKKKKGHPAAPAPPPRNREHGESFNRSGGKGRADSVLGLIVWLLFELVLVATVLAQTLAAIDDRDAAADFRSAPTCLSQPAPAVQDCRSWQDVMVTATSAVTSRGSTTYTITAGSYVVTYFDSAPAWIKHVAKGQQVEMLVWEGNPEALRSPSGDVEYTEDAAPSRHILHIAGAALTPAACSSRCSSACSSSAVRPGAAGDALPRTPAWPRPGSQQSPSAPRSHQRTESKACS